jgi:flagellar export protein FliJ
MAIKEQYRLQVLLEMRERAKKDAEEALGKAMAELKAEQDRQKSMEQELERMVARREAKKREYAEKAMRGEMAAQGAISANLYIDRLKEQEELQKNAIEGQKAVVAQKEEAVTAARENLLRATQDLKALEKHKEMWEEQIKKELEAKEAENLDEIAQTVYLGRQRDMKAND